MSDSWKPGRCETIDISPECLNLVAGQALQARIRKRKREKLGSEAVKGSRLGLVGVGREGRCRALF